MVVKTLRRLSSVGAMLLVVALFAPLGASARPSPPSLVAPVRAGVGAHLIVSRVSSAPARVRAGHAYVLHGTVRNDGSAAARGPVVVHLLRVGSSPRAVGRAPVSLGAHASATFR